MQKRKPRGSLGALRVRDTVCHLYSRSTAYIVKTTLVQPSDARRARESNPSGCKATRLCERQCPVPTGNTRLDDCLPCLDCIWPKKKLINARRKITSFFPIWAKKKARPEPCLVALLGILRLREAIRIRESSHFAQDGKP